MTLNALRRSVARRMSKFDKDSGQFQQEARVQQAAAEKSLALARVA